MFSEKCNKIIQPQNLDWTQFFYQTQFDKIIIKIINNGNILLGYNDLYEEDDEEEYDDDLDDEEVASPRERTAIEEQWDNSAGFELTSVEQETYEKYFYGTEHWNYFTNDEDLGPVILSIKQETLNGRDQFRILVRAISYTVHGLIPASCVFADRLVL